MIRITFLALAAILVAAATSPLTAQQRPSAEPKPGLDSAAAAVRVASEAAADSALRELTRAVAVLARTVHQTVNETADKPELRLAAVQVAGQAVALAQKTLTENMSDIERLLTEARRAIAEVEATQKAKVEKP